MKKLLLFLLLSSLVIAGCSSKDITNNGDSTGMTGDANTSWDSVVVQAPVISQLNIYQVILDGSESDFTWVKMIIWCNDSLVALPVKTSIQDSTKFMSTWELLKSYDAEDKWFMNPWKWQDQIAFQSYEIQGKKLIIKLTWLLKLAWACDTPRLEESLKSTFRVYGFEEVELLINWKAISAQ